MDQTLPRALPEAVGVSSGAVAAFLDAAAAEGLELHSLMVARAGQVAVEGWWAPYRAELPHMTHSLTKSFTAAAVGVAIGQGRFGLDDRVAEFFPALAGVPGEHLAAMTVRHLLTMTSGHAAEIGGNVWRQLPGSWIEAFLAEPVLYAPGRQFVYSSASSYMLSGILQRVTGERLHNYLASRVLRPIGVAGESWDISPEGVNPGGNGLSCRTEDVLRLGLLHLADGVWDGRRLLPPGWVAEATRAHVTAPSGPEARHLDGERWSRGYGYHWWTGPDGAYYASGMFGQYAIVLPRQGAVVAVTGALAQGDQRLLDLVWRDLVPGLGRVTPGGGALAERLAGLHVAVPVLGSATGMAVSGLWFRAEPNADGVEAFRLVFEAGACVFELRDERGEHAVRAGLNDWVEGFTTMSGAALHHQYQPGRMRVVAGSGWTSPGVFRMVWQFIDTAFRDTVMLTFGNGSVRLERGVNVNSGPLQRPMIVAQSADLRC